MTDIAELERRIAFALERIGRGVDQLMVARAAAVQAAESVRVVEVEAETAFETSDEAELDAPLGAEAEEFMAKAAAEAAAEVVAEHLARIAELTGELETERAASAQLSERVRAIREKQETTLATMERRLAEALGAQQSSLTEVSRLRRANAELMSANQALLDAGGDLAPHLVNTAMRAELEALRAARAAEARELDEIIEGIEPLLASKEARPLAMTMTEGDSHA